MNVEHVIRCNKINRYFVKWINEMAYIDIDDNGNAIDSSFQIESESFNTLFAFVNKFKLNPSLFWDIDMEKHF